MLKAYFDETYDKDLVDLEYVKKNKGIYKLVGYDSYMLSINNLDDLILISNDGTPIKASDFLWAKDKFIKVDSLTVTFKNV